MEQFNRLWTGQQGLAKTYWFFGVLAGLIWGGVFSIVTPGSPAAIFAASLFCAYFIVVNTGIWRAATQYTGLKVWAVLAKVAAAIGFVAVAILVFALASAVTGIGANRNGQPTSAPIDWEKGVMTPPSPAK